MFDIGFTELLLVGIIGLLVIGPEQLPTVAQKVGTLWRQLKGQVDRISHSIQQELDNIEGQENALEFEKKIKQSGSGKVMAEHEQQSQELLEKLAQLDDGEIDKLDFDEDAFNNRAQKLKNGLIFGMAGKHKQFLEKYLGGPSSKETISNDTTSKTTIEEQEPKEEDKSQQEPDLRPPQPSSSTEDTSNNKTVH